MSEDPEFEPTAVVELLAYTRSDTGSPPLTASSLLLLQLSSDCGNPQKPSAALPALCLRCTDAYLIFWKREAFELSIITTLAFPHISGLFTPRHSRWESGSIFQLLWTTPRLQGQRRGKTERGG